MSVQAMTWVLEHSAASGNARCVLLSIANHADRQGAYAWPSIETVSKEAKCSPATVKRACIELRKLGELEWQRGAGHEGARRKSNLYWLPLMRVGMGLLPSPTTAQSEPSSLTDKGSSDPDKGSNQPSQGLTGEPRTVLNRPIEPHGGVSHGPRTPKTNGAAKVKEIREELERRIAQEQTETKEVADDKVADDRG